MARTGTADDALDLGSWCILRMASADTLKVLRALQMVGLSVWTPVERRMKKMPRNDAQFDKEIPLMPSYVFGHVQNLPELLRLAMVPGTDLPRFSMFRHQGGIPLIADDQLNALRAEEERTTRVFEKLRRRGLKGPKFDGGMTVRTTEGPFEGLSGVVEGQRGEFTLVSYAGFHQPIKIASLLLVSDVASGEMSDAA